MHINLTLGMIFVFEFVFNEHLRHCLVQGKVNGKKIGRKESSSKFVFPLFGCTVREERKCSLGGSHIKKTFRSEMQRKVELHIHFDIITKQPLLLKTFFYTCAVFLLPIDFLLTSQGFKLVILSILVTKLKHEKYYVVTSYHWSSLCLSRLQTFSAFH